MSVNYYWAHEPVLLPTGIMASIDEDDSDVHIGKLTSNRFIWAQAPGEVEAVCQLRSDEPLIQSEYGERLTCEAFLEMIADIPHDTSSVGVRFS